MKALPQDNQAAMEVFHQYRILDTELESAFDDLTDLAAQICNTPIALVNLIDECRQWFEPKVVEVTTSREVVFCDHAILQSDILVVPDTLSDPQFATNPLVTSIREITKTSLETYNYRVLTASDGIEGVALYAQHQDEIGVVLMDQLMPSMDGPMATRMLQKMNPEVKVVAVSGFATSDKVAEVASIGVKTFLSKPYTGGECWKSYTDSSTIHRRALVALRIE